MGFRRIYHVLVVLIALLSFAAVGGAFAFVYPLFIEARTLAQNLKTQPEQASTAVYDQKGALIGEYAHEKRVWVRLDEMPRYLVDAFLSSEDRDFYEHMGVSPKAILRAAFKNARSGGVVQGGSTITQQLARSLFLSSEQTFTRKLREAVLALEIERQFSKATILETYLNCVYLGNHSYGVEAAARNYFRKRASDLNPAEASLLAGLPQAPSKLAPHRHFAAAKRRQSQVLERMVADQLLSSQEAGRWFNHDIKVEPQAETRRDEEGYLLNSVQADLRRKLDLAQVNRSALNIHTTLQQTVMADMAQKVKDSGLISDPALEVAQIQLDPKTGQVLGFMGGKDFNLSQFDRVHFAKRSLGTLSPLLTLLSATDAGLNLYARLDKSFGHVSLFEASVLEDFSSMQLFGRKLGLERIAAFLERTPFLKGELAPAVLDGSIAVSPKSLALLFAAITQNGNMAEAYFTEKIEHPDGSILYKRPLLKPRPIFKSTGAYLSWVTLQELSRQQELLSTSGSIGLMGHGFDLRDAWLVRANSDLVEVVWIGADKGQKRIATDSEKLRKQLRQWAKVWWGDAPKSVQSHAAPKGVHYRQVRFPKLERVRVIPFQTVPQKG